MARRDSYRVLQKGMDQTTQEKVALTEEEQIESEQNLAREEPRIPKGPHSTRALSFVYNNRLR